MVLFKKCGGRIYGAQVKAPLAEVWEIFDYPCGQRLAPILREQGELRCGEAVAELLKRMSAKTADRLLTPERQVRQPRRQRRAPVKLPSKWDREEVGNLEAGFVVHCGGSMAGEYVHTLSAVDIASGWWEGEPQMGRSQKATEEGFRRCGHACPSGCGSCIRTMTRRG